MNTNLTLKIMGWGTDFKADVYLSRQKYQSKQEVLDRIDEIDKEIHNIETRLCMYASSTPRDVITEQDVNDAVSWMGFNVGCLLEEYRDLISSQSLLLLYVDYLTDNNIDRIKHDE